MVTNNTLEDVPFETRAALYEITRSQRSTLPLTDALRSLNIEDHYTAISHQIRGLANLTPNTLVSLCKLYADFTPIKLLFSEHGLGVSITGARNAPASITNETLDVQSAVGRLSATVLDALSDGRISREEGVDIAIAAERCIALLNDLISATRETR